MGVGSQRGNPYLAFKGEWVKKEQQRLSTFKALL